MNADGNGPSSSRGGDRDDNGDHHRLSGQQKRKTEDPINESDSDDSLEFLGWVGSGNETTKQTKIERNQDHDNTSSLIVSIETENQQQQPTTVVAGDKNVPWTQLPPATKEIGYCPQTGTYEVEKVLGRRKSSRGDWEYLVKWKYWSDNFNSWVPNEDLSCQELIDDFLEAQRVEDGKDKISLNIAEKNTAPVNMVLRSKSAESSGPIQCETQSDFCVSKPSGSSTQKNHTHYLRSCRGSAGAFGPSKNKVAKGAPVPFVEERMEPAVSTIDLDTIRQFLEEETFSEIIPNAPAPMRIYEFIIYEGIKGIRVAWPNHLVQLIRYDEAKQLWPEEIKTLYNECPRKDFELDD